VVVLGVVVGVVSVVTMMMTTMITMTRYSDDVIKKDDNYEDEDEDSKL